MSTPEIDLRNMLDREAYDEDLDDAYNHWIEYDVIPDLAKYLSAFDYERFDIAVTKFKIIGAEPFISWIFEIITDSYDVYYAFMMRERDDIDFNEIAEAYVNHYSCLHHFIEYKKSQEEW